MRFRPPAFAELFVALSIAPFVSSVAGAQDDVQNGATTGNAGASVAHRRSNVSLTVNPAGLAATARYDIDLSGGLQTGGGAISFSTVDSRTTRLAVGVGYQRLDIAGTPPQALWPAWIPSDASLASRRKIDQFSGGVALPFADRHFTLGVNGTVLLERSDDGRRTITGNADLGIGAYPSTGFSFGLVGRNLLPLVRSDAQPLGLISGFVLGDPENTALSAEGEYQRSLTPWQARIGLERRFEPFTIRAGYHWTGGLNVHAATIGVGVDAAGGGLDLGTEIPIGFDRGVPWVARLGVRIRG